MADNATTGYLWLDREPTAQAVHAEMARLEKVGCDLYVSEQQALDDFDNACDDFPHAGQMRLVEVQVSTCKTMELRRSGWVDVGAERDAVEAQQVAA